IFSTETPRYKKNDLIMPLLLILEQIAANRLLKILIGNLPKHKCMKYKEILTESLPCRKLKRTNTFARAGKTKE
ncbi:MAG: hypothetical protein Q8829_02915, partial [Candidatus Phytoplasma australasiaticum]|nr:hypothetical protein [Candidatus Phytoplasma australasiaticum]